MLQEYRVTRFLLCHSGMVSRHFPSHPLPRLCALQTTPLPRTTHTDISSTVE